MNREIVNESLEAPFNVSQGNLIRRFKRQVSVTWLLVLVEGLLYLVLPLLIGSLYYQQLIRLKEIEGRLR